MWTQVCTGRRSFKSQVIHQFFFIFMWRLVRFLFPPLFLMPGAYMLLKMQLVLPTQNFFMTSPVHNNTAQQTVLLSMLQHPNFFLTYLFPGLLMHRIFTNCYFTWEHAPPIGFWELLGTELAEGKAFPGRKHTLGHDHMALTGRSQNSVTRRIAETPKFRHFQWSYYFTISRKWNFLQRTRFHE